MKQQARDIQIRDLFEHLKIAKVPAIAREVKEMLNEPGALSEEVLNEICHLFECEVTSRKDKKVREAVRKAHLPYENAHRNELIVEGTRIFNKEDFNILFRRYWLEAQHNIIISGKGRVGKSYLASALCVDAIECGKSVHYMEFDELINQLNLESLSATSEPELLRCVDQCDVIAIDNWCYHDVTPLTATMMINYLEKTIGQVSLILTSERTTDEWKKALTKKRAEQKVLTRVIGRANQIQLLPLSKSTFIASEGRA